MAYGWYSFDMEELEGQEVAVGRAGIMLVLDLPAIAEDPADRPKLPLTCTLIPDWRQGGEALCPRGSGHRPAPPNRTRSPQTAVGGHPAATREQHLQKKEQRLRE